MSAEKEKSEKQKEISKLDRDILACLQKDARQSYRKIASDLGISVGTVHNRIKRLMNSKILNGFRPILNSKALGYELCFLIAITIRGGHTSEVFDLVKKKPFVHAIYQTTGDTSAALVCHFRKIEEAREFMSEINQNKYVEKTISNFVLDTIKEENQIRLPDEQIDRESHESPP